MSALGKVVRAGVGRRRVQTAVMVLTTMTAVAACVMAAALVVASRGPFDHAFARHRGAHLTAYFDGSRATRAQVAATARAAGATASAGPYRQATVVPHFGGAGAMTATQDSAITVTGRASAAGALDTLTVTDGHWLSGPDQIVLDSRQWDDAAVIGTRVTFPTLPGAPTLTVVGLARSVTGTGDAWVAPGLLPALTRPGRSPAYEMLYRFAHAGSTARMTADRAAVTAAAPPGSLTGAQSYLTVRQAANRQTATFVPFVTAFGVLALVMSVLVIGIVVSGAVSSGTRRIGVLKSLGFTPGQIGRAYVAQALLPAIAGTALGAVIGDLGSVPLLRQASDAYRTGSLDVAPWIDAAVPAAVLLLVVLSALAPALRAARLRTVTVLATGRTPRTGRGRLAARGAARLPLPRALGMGAAAPFARPARSLMIGAAIVFGAAGTTFAYGLGASLNAVQHGLDRESPGQVVVQAGMPSGGHGPAPGSGPGSGSGAHTAPGPGTARPAAPTAADIAGIAAAVAHRPGTRAFFGTAFAQVRVAGLSGACAAVGYQGDSAWGRYQMVSGHWFDGPGQIVVARQFLKATGTRVGDRVTLRGAGHDTSVRIVGEAMMTGDGGLRVLTDAATLTGAGLHLGPMSFQVDLATGTDRAAYLRDLNAALRPLHGRAVAGAGGTSSTIVAMDAITVTLSLLLIVVAGLGVLTTVVLDTRERVHDLGVLKALGMSPRQTVAMVLTSATGVGLVAGLAGVPLGVALHRCVVPRMGDAAGTSIPGADLHVYHLAVVAPLFAGGLVVAASGAVHTAVWAARARTARALRTE